MDGIIFLCPINYVGLFCIFCTGNKFEPINELLTKLKLLKLLKQLTEEKNELN